MFDRLPDVLRLFAVALLLASGGAGCLKSVAVHPCQADPGSTACLDVCATVMARAAAQPGAPGMGK